MKHKRASALFQPEFAGKIGFYLSAVDDLLRHSDDKPSIGIILCKTKHRCVGGSCPADIVKDRRILINL